MLESIITWFVRKQSRLLTDSILCGISKAKYMVFTRRYSRELVGNWWTFPNDLQWEPNESQNVDYRTNCDLRGFCTTQLHFLPLKHMVAEECSGLWDFLLHFGENHHPNRVVVPSAWFAVCVVEESSQASIYTFAKRIVATVLVNVY